MQAQGTGPLADKSKYMRKGRACLSVVAKVLQLVRSKDFVQ